MIPFGRIWVIPEDQETGRREERRIKSVASQHSKAEVPFDEAWTKRGRITRHSEKERRQATIPTLAKIAHATRNSA